MKRKLYFRIGAVAVISVLLAACSKDDTKPPKQPTPVTVKTLSTPADAANFELETTENVVFEWGAATTVSRADEVTYEVLFDYADGDFSDPLYTVPADEEGTLTKATISKNVLIDIAREWGAEAGETANLIWSVKTTQGSKALVSDQTRSITLVRPQAVEPAGPPVVTELLGPDDQKEIELASTPTLSFKWKEAESNGEVAVRYSLLFDVEGGDFSEPLYSTVSASNGLDPRVALTAKQLDAIAKAAGIEPETEGSIIWTVFSKAGEETYLSEEKSALKITRLAEMPAIVTTLKSPANWEEIDILTTEGMTFEWEAAVTTGENVTYELLFDKVTGNFTQPLKTYTSANNGSDPNVTLSQTELSELAEAAGAGFMTPATIKWKVLTKAGEELNLSETLRNITLVGGSMFNIGDDLYMGGAGAEAGHQFRYVDNGQSKYYEIYTQITGNQPFYFYTGENDGDGAKLVKSSTGDGIKEVAANGSESSKLSKTGVYRITFDCDAMTAKFETVEKVRLRYPINGSETVLDYAGKGVWRRDHHLIALENRDWGVEARYKFRMTVDGTNVDYGWGKSTAADQTRFMKTVKVDDWTDTWTFPSNLQQSSLRQHQARYYTDVVFDMSYTYSDGNWPVHRFEGREDSQAYYDGDLNTPGRSVWEAAADSCTFILIDQFMNKNRGTFWASAGNVLNNSGVLFWQQAYPMHTMLYSYQRIKDSNASLAAQYKSYADLWIRNNGNNWYGNKKNGFYNEYTDDMAWMALVFIHMYETFGEEQYLTKAKEIYGYMTESQRIVDDAKGWGLIWKINGGGGRNACTNTPAIITAAKLYQITGTQQYLDEAIKMYGFMSTFTNDILTNGRVEEPALTYTQGCWIEGCRLLYHITGDSKYRDNATVAVNYTMNSGRCTNGIVGILRDEGTSGDQSNFKGGLMPYMINFINDTDMPADKRQEARTFMIKNARYMWFHNMDKTLYPKTFANYSFSSYYREEGNPGSLGAHNSAAALLEGITRLTDL